MSKIDVALTAGVAAANAKRMDGCALGPHTRRTTIFMKLFPACLCAFALAVPAVAAATSPPFLGYYLQLDGKFYTMDQVPAGGGAQIQYFSIGQGQYTLSAENVQMSTCTNAPDDSTASMIFYHGFIHPPIAPLKGWSYRLYGNNMGTVAVLTVTTFAGQTDCVGQVPPPPAFTVTPPADDVIFVDGFDASAGSPSVPPDTIFSAGFDGSNP